MARKKKLNSLETILQHPPSVVGYVRLDLGLTTTLRTIQDIAEMIKRLAIEKHEKDRTQEIRILIQTVERDTDPE